MAVKSTADPKKSGRVLRSLHWYSSLEVPLNVDYSSAGPKSMCTLGSAIDFLTERQSLRSLVLSEAKVSELNSND